MPKMTGKKILPLLFATVFVVAGAISASAATIDFGIVAPTAGTISYAGGAAPLVGSGITVDNFVGLGTPLNDGFLYDFDTNAGSAPPGTYGPSYLNFTTGNLTSSTSNTWNFAGGGSITLEWPGGGYAGANALFTGSFSNVSVTAFGSTFKIAGASFVDTKNPDLLGYLGLPTDVPYLGNFNISFMATGSPPNGFRSSQVLSGDITNEPVPEPGTMMLLGSGLIGLAGWGRKKFRK